jgi:hypothetical protein
MPELRQDFALLTVLAAAGAVCWLTSALVAFGAFHVYRQRTDLAWLAIFLLLAGVSAGQAYIADAWANAQTAAPPPIDLDAYLSVRLAVLELTAAILAFFAYRRPRARM